MTYYETTVILTLGTGFKQTVKKYSTGEPDLEAIKDDAITDIEMSAPDSYVEIESLFTRVISEDEYLERIKKKPI